jgi:hypothetical protein
MGDASSPPNPPVYGTRGFSTQLTDAEAVDLSHATRTRQSYVSSIGQTWHVLIQLHRWAEFGIY